MVGDMAAGATEERIVLLTRDRRAEAEFARRHGRTYSAGAARAAGAPRRIFSAIQRQTT